jgi:hypothetical protein
MAGIFVSRGMTLRVPAGGMVIGTGDEAFKITSLTMHVRFDVCPTWLEIALNHTEQARHARGHRIDAWKGSDEDLKAKALEKEFESSMQAVMASAIAIDAFYSILAQHVSIPSGLSKKWRDKRTPRYAQVTEVLRRAFKLKAVGTKNLRQQLREIYRFRDMAVHPSGKVEAPLYHPELDVDVEWRFAYFSATNAEGISRVTSWIVWELCKRGKPADDEIKDYVSTLSSRLDQLFPLGHPLVSAADAER